MRKGDAGRAVCVGTFLFRKRHASEAFGGLGLTKLGGFLAITLLLTAVSGCLTEDSKATAADQRDVDAAADGNGTANATGPVAVITVSMDGNVTEAVNGSMPASTGTNVTFNGSASTGDNLTFAWDFGDNATGVNATETHSFADPGLFNVTLTVTSGNETGTASLLLNVTAAAPAGSVLWMDRQSFTGTLTVGNPNAANLADTDHRDHTVTIVAADANGTAVVAKRVRWVLSGSGATNVDMTLYWRKDGTNLATGGTSNTNDETILYEGDMVPGEYVIRVRFNLGASASYTVDGEIDYEAP